MKNLTTINISNLFPHPENPRKNIGDVFELAESIKKSGIMQNLTVIPECALTEEPENQPDVESLTENDKYIVLIGHRRLEASVRAGLTEVPCKIVSKISRSEQLCIMLEENMQREDLTIKEQADGFQLMLDLGLTEDDISKKTGFSKSTIRHRLNIAKLDGDLLKEKENEKEFQISLTDLYELEKIKDVEERNKILKSANSSRDLIWKVQNFVSEAARKKVADKLTELLEQDGIKCAPEKVSNEIYTGKWETIKRYSLEEEAPEKINVKRAAKAEVYYLVRVRELLVVKKVEKKPETEQDKKRKERERRRKEIRELQKNLTERQREFIQAIVKGIVNPLPVKREASMIIKVWEALTKKSFYMAKSSMITYLAGKSMYDLTPEEKEEITKKIDAASTLTQMIMMLGYCCSNIGDISDYTGCFNEVVAVRLNTSFKILKEYGWSFTEEEEALLNGTHELYEKPEPEEPAEPEKAEEKTA